jgi:hypothetical protein
MAVSPNGRFRERHIQGRMTGFRRDADFKWKTRTTAMGARRTHLVAGTGVWKKLTDGTLAALKIGPRWVERAWRMSRIKSRRSDPKMLAEGGNERARA